MILLVAVHHCQQEEYSTWGTVWAAIFHDFNFWREKENFESEGVFNVLIRKTQENKWSKSIFLDVKARWSSNNVNGFILLCQESKFFVF